MFYSSSRYNQCIQPGRRPQMDTQGNLFNFYKDTDGSRRITPVGNVGDMRKFKISEIAGIKLDRDVNVVAFEDGRSLELPLGSGVRTPDGRVLPPAEIVEGVGMPKQGVFDLFGGNEKRMYPLERPTVDLEDTRGFDRQLYDQARRLQRTILRPCAHYSLLLLKLMRLGSSSLNPACSAYLYVSLHLGLLVYVCQYHVDIRILPHIRCTSMPALCICTNAIQCVPLPRRRSWTTRTSLAGSRRCPMTLTSRRWGGRCWRSSGTTRRPASRFLKSVFDLCCRLVCFRCVADLAASLGGRFAGWLSTRVCLFVLGEGLCYLNDADISTAVWLIYPFKS